MNNPFEGLSKIQITKLFDLLEVHIYNYPKNQEIAPTLKTNNIIGIILEGSAEIVKNEYNGNDIVVEKLDKNSIFGSNISATYIENYEVIAKQDTQVLIIDYERLLRPENQKYTYFNIFLTNLFNIINVKFRKANERIKVLEEKQIREKLLKYFEIEYKKTRKKYIELPFPLKDLADYISANRSAMFRELKNLKEEGFISVKNRKIILLYKNNGFDLDL